jgi:hypothetical protein
MIIQPATRQSRLNQEPIMQRYEPHDFRPAFGVAAAALTALTIATLVVGPAELLPRAHAAMQVSGSPMATAPRQVDIAPSQVDVVVLRDAALANAGTPGATPRRAHRG